MIVFSPIQVTDATLTSSNVVESDNPSWSSVTNYNIGDKSMVTTPNIHKNYEALTANINKYPPDNSTSTEPEIATPDWLDLGSTNKWAMFDQLNGSQTTNANTVDVEVTPNEQYNAIALLNIDATSVQITMTDPTDGVVYDEAFELINNDGINNIYDYLFSPIEQRKDLVSLNLPTYSSATIRVVITNDSSTAAVGVMAIGVQTVLGTTTYGTGVRNKDYSIKQTDQFGNFKIKKRGFSKRADYAIAVDSSRVTFVNNYLATIRSIPCVFVGSELPNFGSTIIYGYYKNADPVYTGFQISSLSLSVEGLT